MKETIELVHVLVWILNERRLVDMEEIRAWDGKWKQGYIEYLAKEIKQTIDNTNNTYREVI